MAGQCTTKVGASEQSGERSCDEISCGRGCDIRNNSISAMDQGNDIFKVFAAVIILLATIVECFELSGEEKSRSNNFGKAVFSQSKSRCELHNLGKPFGVHSQKLGFLGHNVHFATFNNPPADWCAFGEIVVEAKVAKQGFQMVELGACKHGHNNINIFGWPEVGQIGTIYKE